jgi:hypothetical protein
MSINDCYWSFDILNVEGEINVYGVLSSSLPCELT